MPDLCTHDAANCTLFSTYRAARIFNHYIYYMFFNTTIKPGTKKIETSQLSNH